ncbi:MAG: MFS transporter [Hyphomicrobium sp.]
MPLLFVLAASCLVSSMTMRLVDPVVPGIARDFAVSAETAALLASAFTFPYALFQPILGSLGDALGKARIIKLSLAVVLVCLVLAAYAPRIEVLFIARMIGGAAAGGIIPLAFAMVGDRIPFAERQVALSRLLTAILAGQLTGSIGSGLLASYAGWRASMVVAAVIALAALVMTVLQLHARQSPDAATRPRFTVAGMRAGYAEVFANPRSPVCFTAVFIGGIVMFGLFPYIAILLEARGAGGLKEAGFVLAGFGIGGILYTALVVMLLRRLGLMNLIRAGGLVAALGLASLALGASWPAEMAAFVLVGVGFYMVHNSLQTQATELAPNARGAAVAAHAFFFFLGQAVGPVVYAFALPALGQGTTLACGALVMAALGFATAHGLLVRGNATSQRAS